MVGSRSFCSFIGLAVLYVVTQTTEVSAQVASAKRARVTYQKGNSQGRGYETAGADVVYQFGECVGNVVMQAKFEPRSLTTTQVYYYKHVARSVPGNIRPSRSSIQFSGEAVLGGRVLGRFSILATRDSAQGLCVGTTIAKLSEHLDEDARKDPRQVEAFLESLSVVTDIIAPLTEVAVERAIDEAERAEQRKQEEAKRIEERRRLEEERKEEQRKLEEERREAAEQRARAEQREREAQTEAATNDAEQREQVKQEAARERAAAEERARAEVRAREQAAAAAREEEARQERRRRDRESELRALAKLRQLRASRAADDRVADSPAAKVKIVLLQEKVLGVERLSQSVSYSMQVEIDERGLTLVSDSRRYLLRWNALETVDVSERGRVRLGFAGSDGEYTADMLSLSSAEDVDLVAAAIRDVAREAGNTRIPAPRAVRDLDSIESDQRLAAERARVAAMPYAQPIAEVGSVIETLITAGETPLWADLDLSLKMSGEGGNQGAVAMRMGKYIYVTLGLFYGETKPHDFVIMQGTDTEAAISKVPMSAWGIEGGMGVSIPLGRHLRLRGEGLLSAATGTIEDEGELGELGDTTKNMFGAAVAAHLVLRVPDLPVGVGVFVRYQTIGLGDKDDPIAEQGYRDTNGNQLPSELLLRTTDQSAHATYGVTMSIVL